jgi:adenine specific DNA methylase Mod
MAKIEITKTELVWPGKYDENGQRREVERVKLPFQVIETINETRATREAAKKPRQPSLFDVWEAKEDDTFEEGWKNKLIWGDNKYVMSSLLDKFAGKIDLIYIDPPFATGADFNFTTQIGEGDLEITKEQSIIEEKAYRDTWGKYGPGRQIDSYLEMMYPRLVLMRELLAESGSVYLHLDSHVGHYVKLLLDEIFGRDNFRNNIVWHYKGGALTGVQRHFPRKHDFVLFYTKSDDYLFNQLREEDVSEQMLKRWGQYADEEGRISFGKIEREGETYSRLRKRFLREHEREPRSLGHQSVLKAGSSRAEQRFCIWFS